MKRLILMTPSLIPEAEQRWLFPLVGAGKAHQGHGAAPSGAVPSNS